MSVQPQDAFEPANDEHLAKIRVNSLGHRYIGYVYLGSGRLRTSDILNQRDPFLILHAELQSGAGAPLIAINKSSISYLATLVEPDNNETRVMGSFERIAATLRQIGKLSGELFIPTESTFEAALNDERSFLNLRNVTFPKSPEQYSFLAVAKRQVLEVVPAI